MRAYTCGSACVRACERNDCAGTNVLQTYVYQLYQLYHGVRTYVRAHYSSSYSTAIVHVYVVVHACIHVLVGVNASRKGAGFPSTVRLESAAMLCSRQRPRFARARHPATSAWTNVAVAKSNLPALMNSCTGELFVSAQYILEYVQCSSLAVRNLSCCVVVYHAVCVGAFVPAFEPACTCVACC